MKKLFVFTLLAAPVLVKAQAFSTGYTDERSHSMGGAGIGVIVDQEGYMPQNPGAVAFLTKNSLSVGGAAAVVNTDYLDKGNNTVSESKNDIGTPFHFNAVYGVKDTASSKLGKFKFGLAIGTPYGGDSRWPNDWTGKNSIIDKKLSSIAIAPGVSYKINDKWGVGVSAGYSMSKLHVENAVPVSQEAKVVMDFTSYGIGYGGGIYYQPTEKVSLGLGYMSQVNNKSIKGTATFQVPALLKDQFPTGDASTKSSVPSIISIGGGYKVNEKLLFALDVQYWMWSCFDSTIFEFTSATPAMAVQSVRIPNEYVNTIAVRLGAQYKATEKITVRAGTSYEQTPIPADYLYPETPDADRINLTLGGGYNINDKFTVDVSYRFTNLMKRSAVNKYSAMDGTYKTYAHVTGVSLFYKF